MLLVTYAVHCWQLWRMQLVSESSLCGQTDAAALQALDAEALAALLESVNLHSAPATTAAGAPSQEGSVGQEGCRDNGGRPQQAPAEVSTEKSASERAGSAASEGIEQGSLTAPQGLPNHAAPAAWDMAAAGQDLLADCPLPFQDISNAAVAKTPARARRGGGKKAAAPHGDSDEEERVSDC